MTAQPDVTDSLNQAFLRDYPDEAGAWLQDFPPQDVAAILDRVEGVTLSKTWQLLPPAFADSVLIELSDRSVQTLLTHLAPADCAQVVNRLPKPRQQHFLGLLPEQYANDLQALMDFPEGSAGRVMDPRVLLFFADENVDDVLNALRRLKQQRDRKLFVVDAERHLIGVVDIQDVALSEKDERLKNLMRPPSSMVMAMDSTEMVAELLGGKNLEVLPVVDMDQKMLGVIRQPTLLKTLQEDSLGDLQTMVGVSREERALSSFSVSIRKRLPWMQVNLLTAFMAAAVVGLFENTIAQFTALAVLLPVVAGQSGNAGAQAQAVTMRGLALKEVTPRNWRQLVLKELRVGAANGVAVALTTGLGVWVWSQNLGLALVIASAMVISMSIACMSGTMVPVVLSKLGQDPAQSSSIILTTITDVVGLMSFLGIATLMAALL